MTYFPKPAVTIGDGPNLDAFSRLRVSNPDVLFATTQRFGIPIDLEALNTSDGVAPTFVANTRMTTLKVSSGATGGKSTLQSFQYWPYQAGRSQMIAITGVLGAAVTGAVFRAGYGDDENGIFLERSGSTVQVNRRTKTSGSVVDNTVAQASWNLDALNGSGPSGITINLELNWILVIDLQYLGMGRVRIGFDIGGSIVYCHEFRNANNVLVVPYMQTASLPVRAQITAAAGLGANAFAYIKCFMVMSEGGNSLGEGYSFAAEGTVTAASGTRTHILSVRPKTTFGGIANRLMFQLDSVELLTGANAVLWELCVGSTYSAGPTWADVDGTYSGFERGVTGTLSAAGTVIASGYGASGGGSTRTAGVRDISVKNPICLDASGAVRALGTLSLILTGVSGTSACRASFNWREIP